MDNQRIKHIRTIISLLAILGIGYGLGYNSALNSGLSANAKHDATDPSASQTTLPHSGSKTTQSPTHAQPITEPSSTEPSSTPALASKAPSPTLTALFEQLLIMGKYAEAINLYHTAWNISQKESDKLRQQFITHIQQLITPYQPANTNQINNALETYLADFYDDISVLLLQSFHQKQQGFFYEMLNTLQLAKTYAYTEKQQQQLSASYRQLINQIDEYFVDQNNLHTLIDLYSHAETIDLLTEDNQFRLITLYLQTNNPIQAQPYIDQLKTNPAWQEKLAALLPAPKPSTEVSSKDKASQHAIALTKVGHQFVINTKISAIDTPLLIDTGASVTTITQAYYETIKRKANLRFLSQQTFNTANGKTTGTIYQVDQLALGEYQLNNVDIAVLDYPSSQHSVGLLGMNVLRHFEFEINQQNSQLILKTVEENIPR